ncbi:nitrate reductase molybdenum cofactor assembly chaperone [Bordetella genomosp. 10]|uniref:Nitrate reductase molybdenum cofactor assembly chaperone n=1 Tax=Bordetella genomosp. 10 TaxID=1416804 RepID=A0A261SKJ5_9BORD|nr:nitrate reductase molybdenum cofactor assembly chaperone [Bordetella genomosp. 10]OZI37527.1 nitrate reductase molybdenum cofactor assembly chaperone [Bordetella genomosp. 10]
MSLSNATPAAESDATPDTTPDTTPAGADAELYAALSLLLRYPEADWVSALPEMRQALPAAARAALAPLLAWFANAADLIALQEVYVETFDSRPAHSLHLFEHVHGQSRDRGQAMVDLREEYLAHGLAPDPAELPDYVPLFLEFLARIPPADASRLLGDAIHVLARLGDKLAEAKSPYACVFAVLRGKTDVQPQPLPEAPEGGLEETPVVFGPEAGGPGTMLRQMQGEAPLRFHASDPRGKRGGAAPPAPPVQSGPART